MKMVTGLQIRLINSLDAKLLSVLQVTTNKGRSTAGVDRQVITNPKRKLKMAIELKLDGKAKPIRRVFIPKPGKAEMRPLGIPTIKDRAKQQLARNLSGKRYLSPTRMGSEKAEVVTTQSKLFSQIYVTIAPNMFLMQTLGNASMCPQL